MKAALPMTPYSPSEAGISFERVLKERSRRADSSHRGATRRPVTSKQSPGTRHSTWVSASRPPKVPKGNPRANAPVSTISQEFCMTIAWTVTR